MHHTVQKTFRRFLDLPDFRSQAPAAAASEAKPRFDFRVIRPTPSGNPEDADLWSVVNLSDRNDHIRRANLDLMPDSRAGLYSIWFRGNPRTFLLLERSPPDKNGVAIIGNTIILPLKQPIFARIEAGQLPVTALQQDDMCGMGQDFDILLFDTWVMHDDYQDIESRFFRRITHFGYGNALTLRHLAVFWNPATKPSLRLAVEPDSQSIMTMLRRIGFATKGQTKIKKPLLELVFPPQGPDTPDNALVRTYVRETVRKIEECSSWNLA